MKKSLKYCMSLALLLGSVGVAGCDKTADDTTSNWINGAGAPTVANKGKLGQFYFDTVNHDVYSYTANGWVLTSDLEVKQEEPNKWLNGAGAPTGTIGKVGDFYFDTVNHDVYSYTASGWVLTSDLEIKQEEKVSLDGEYINDTKMPIHIYNDTFVIDHTHTFGTTNYDVNIKGTYTIIDSNEQYGEYTLKLVSDDGAKEFVIDISIPLKTYTLNCDNYSGEYKTTYLSRLLGLENEELTFNYDEESGVITVPEIEGVGEVVGFNKFKENGTNCIIFNISYKDPNTNEMVTKENLWLLVNYFSEGTEGFGYKKTYPFIGDTVLAYNPNYEYNKLMYGGYFDEDHKFQVSLFPYYNDGVVSTSLYSNENGYVALRVGESETLEISFGPFKATIELSDLPAITNNQMIITTNDGIVILVTDTTGKIIDVAIYQSNS